MNNLIVKARTLGRSARLAAIRSLRWTVARLRSAWLAHRTLIETNSAYGAALAAGAASIVGQISWERSVVAVVSAGLAIYVAVRRRAGWGSRAPGFNPLGDEWDATDATGPTDLTPRWR